MMVFVDVNFNLVVDVGDVMEVCVGIEIMLGGLFIGVFVLGEFGDVIVGYVWLLIVGLSSFYIVNLMVIVMVSEIYEVMVYVISGCIFIVSVDVSVINCGVLGNFVWNDINQDGIQNNGEIGILNVMVNLLDVLGI